MHYSLLQYTCPFVHALAYLPNSALRVLNIYSYSNQYENLIIKCLSATHLQRNPCQYCKRVLQALVVCNLVVEAVLRRMEPPHKLTMHISCHKPHLLPQLAPPTLKTYQINSKDIDT